jgi:TadE-like protein
MPRRSFGRAGRSGGRPRHRGQSLVEYAMTVPVFLLILLGMLEFGFAFSHHLTMEYSTREGARTGASLANGSAQVACATVDDHVIAAVQRVLTGAGSQVSLNRIGEIRIYKSDSAGRELGPVNRWTLGAGPTVEGAPLLFHQVSSGWSACGRKNLAVGTSDRVDSIGVSITYDYDFITPLGSLMGITGNAQLHMSDRTVMSLNPD